MVQKCQDGPKRVPNCQKHLGLSFWTLLDPFGLLWNVDKPDMFGHFCLFYWCVFFGTPCIFTCYLGTEIQSMLRPKEHWQDFQVGQLTKSWVEWSVEVWSEGGCKSNVCEL